MSHVEMIRVEADGVQKTVSFSTDHLNGSNTAQQLSARIGELMGSLQTGESEDHCLKLDFTNVDRINTAALNELIRLNRKARNRGIRFELLDVQQTVRNVFALTRLERMFEFSSTAVTA
jgi:anti-anti-sigma factor